MIANLKKSFKLLRYGHDIKGNTITIIALLAGIILAYYLTFGVDFGMQLIAYVLLFFCFMIPLQIKEDLMLSRMLASSGLRRFFDVNFADILLLVGSLASFWINARAVLLFFKEGALEGSTTAGLLLTSGCSIGILTIFQGLMVKQMAASIGMYFSVCVCVGIMEEIIEDFTWNPGKVQALIIGTCFVLMGNLIAMWLRRKMYKKPLSKYANSEGLKKAMV